MNRNERLIVRTMLAEAAAAGWELEILFDGEQDHKHLTTEAAIELANNLESCHWNFRLPAAKSTSGKVARGWVHTIFANGNDGLDVISDNTVNLDSFHELVDVNEPRTPRPHGFLGKVEEFREELEFYTQGHEAYKPEISARYGLRDRIELAAQAMYAHLREYIRDYGRRGADDPTDALLPIEQQDKPVAEAMLLLQKEGLPW